MGTRGDSRDDTVAARPGARDARSDELESARTVASPPPSNPPAASTESGSVALGPGDPRRYAVGKLLGQGGMGEVLLAYDGTIGREVAMKRIRAGGSSAELLSRFVREARVQGRLEHPAVVPVHDLALDPDGRPYFVMKRLTGTTLSELLAALRSERGAAAEATRRRMLRAFADVCLAVEFAHKVGIIHRDLKPANIMLGDFGEVYVLDWGVARALTDPDDAPTGVTAAADLQLDSGQTSAGTILGTPAYMAPEQLAGEPAGPAADIYALGCILFEIATGELLHGGRRSLTSLLEPLDARPSRRQPDSPPELDAICQQATHLEPGARFESARDLGDAVQAYLDGDRDLVVRAELARHHLGLARAAMQRAEDPASRSEAMQAAGRALALDPNAIEAATLITRLLLEPPATTPPEVEREIARRDHATARTQGRLAALTMLGYLAFVPLLMWTGVRSYPVVVAFAALAFTSGLQVWMLTFREQITRRGIYLNACVNALLIAMVCRLVGPFIIAPTLVTTTLIAYAAHPALGSIRVVAVILASGVAVPWALELLGVLTRTYHFVDGNLVLSSAALTFTAAPVQLAFALLLVALVGIVALLARGMALRQRGATRALELQAWHLRQILPSSEG